MNRLGLVSQMSKRRYIATNLYRKKVPADILIEIRKPPAVVNETNYRYLQLLDAISDIDEAPVDTTRPAEVIKNIARELGLNTEMLILMARRHYNQKTLLRTIDIMLEVKTSFSHYIFEQRMKLEDQLLKRTSFSIQEIALKCGFQNTSYFSTCYKKFCGKQSSQVRLKNKYSI